MLCHMSQTEFAKALGVSRGLVGQWESHKKKPGRENLARIAQVTMTSMPYLMGTESLDQITVPVSNPLKLDILRQLDRLTPLQQENLRQLLGMSIEIREHIEKQRSPTEGEDVS